MKNKLTKSAPAAKPAKQNGIGPVRLYRADLLQDAKAAADDSFADLAELTRLSKQTVLDAINGNASKLDAIYVLAKHYGIDWLELFDVDKRLVFSEGRAIDVDRPKRNALTYRAPKKAK